MIHEDDRQMRALLHIVVMKPDGLRSTRELPHAVYTEFDKEETRQITRSMIDVQGEQSAD